jgi:hypothetical protein
MWFRLSSFGLKSRGVGFSPEGTYRLARLGSLERLPHSAFQTHS